MLHINLLMDGIIFLNGKSIKQRTKHTILSAPNTTQALKKKKKDMEKNQMKKKALK